jgi:hypothetical protein
LTALTTLRDQLKTGLSTPVYAGADQEQTRGAEPVPTVSELAKRIKALKAAHTIEAAPERSAVRQVSAEEPVTARIRRRADTQTGPTHQERLEAARRQQASELSFP